MGTIGIVANPNSGKDIRRLVTHATVIDNAEKVNILRRILTGIAGMGPHRVVMMPDRGRLAAAALGGLAEELCTRVSVPQMPVLDRQDDTTRFVQLLREEFSPDVLVVLGGDGTCRAAAKTVGEVPLIPVSTGTNNVYPALTEGTAVAFAAAAIASGLLARESFAHGKRMEVAVGSRREDIALVDAVFCHNAGIGARAILQQEEIGGVWVTQCRPDSIGFSALAGSVQPVGPQDEGGLYIEPDWQQQQYIASFSAGALVRFGVRACKPLSVGVPFKMAAPREGTIALDGERELYVGEGEALRLTLTRNGPRRVDVHDAVHRAAALGFFRL